MKTIIQQVCLNRLVERFEKNRRFPLEITSVDVGYYGEQADAAQYGVGDFQIVSASCCLAQCAVT